MDKSENTLGTRPQLPGERPLDRVRELQVDLWRQGQWKPIEQLCKHQFADLSLTGDEYLELILAEHDLRNRLGEHPAVAEYIERFPGLKDRLPSLFAIAAQLEDIPFTEGDSKLTQALSVVAAWPYNQSEQSSQAGLDHSLSETLANVQAAECPTNHAGSGVVIVPECGMKVGKYRLVEKLGQGGMGTVFRASHSLIDHHVALKLMLPHLVGQQSLQKRFLKEAQVCVGLHHPNLVRTFDIDQDGGCLYLTMELLTGCHLAERVAQRGPLSSRVAANIIRQVAEGLAYAHSRGIIHRDVKPQNIMLTDDNQVKVLDLGLARLLGDFGSEGSPVDSQVAENDWQKKLKQSVDELVTQAGRLTYAGTILGTLGYMSREQATNPGVADARNDIFSLGCTAYFLLTGESIHGDRTAREILQRLISHTRWSNLPLDGVCEQWQELLEKMLAWNADDRIESMQEVIAAIDAAFELGRPWKPDPDNLSQLKRKLIELQLVSEEQWNYAESNLDSFNTTANATLGPSWNLRSSRTPTPALQFLFRLTQTTLASTGESILTQYQVEQILAGHASTLRQGKQLVRESLNRGWKGEVFLACNTESDRKETLRMLPIDQLHGLASRSDVAAAVHQAGAHLKRLEHPNLAKIYRFELQDDWLLIASEHLRGETLRESVRHVGTKKTPLDAHAMVKTAIELAGGVQYLHEQGCLHLDLCPDRWIKPANGPWCLLDAGWVPLLLSKQWKTMPQSSGLPCVLPPELMQDLASVSALTDIYALGHVFRFLMSGEFPFRPMKLSEFERPILPPVSRPRYSQATESMRSSKSIKLPRLRSPRSESGADDWRIQWSQLLDSMTSAVTSARPQTAAQVVQRLSEIAELTRAEYPGRSLAEEVSICREPGGDRMGQAQPSFSQRLRRLFGPSP